MKAKNNFKLCLFLLWISLFSGCAGPEQDRILTETQRQKLAARADLVLQAEVAAMPRNVQPDAIEAFPHPTVSAAFKVIKIAKGEWKKPVMVILVQNPLMTFGELPSPGSAARKQYFFYFKKESGGQLILIGVEWKIDHQAAAHFRYTQESDAERKTRFA